MRATVDANEAAVWVAFRCSEVCCIFPITPSSPMAELADEWSSKGRTKVPPPTTTFTPLSPGLATTWPRSSRTFAPRDPATMSASLAPATW